MIQVYFSGHGAGASLGEATKASVLEPEARRDETDLRASGCRLSRSSLSEDESFFSVAAPDLVPKSKAVPGVLGVFPELPKLAKAPLPRPKAEEAAPVPVGDETEEVVTGPTALKGLLLPWLLFTLPNLFAEGVYVLSESDLLVERLSLVLLLVACRVSGLRTES